MRDLIEELRMTAAQGAVKIKTRFAMVRVVYAVNHAFPLSSNGYAVRTHAVAKAMVEAGVDVVVVSRNGVRSEALPDRDVECGPVGGKRDGVRYVYLQESGRVGNKEEASGELALAAFEKLLRVFRPSAVMAASNWRNAVPAAVAARRAGLPFWYEVRGFWEMSRAERVPGWGQSPGYAEDLANEKVVAQSADRVFTLNRLMAEELIRRGVEPERIELVPNGFEPDPVQQEADITRESVGIKSDFVVGYVGSFNGYEGLEDLIETVARLRGCGINLSVLLVGSSTQSGGVAVPGCPVSAKYRSLAASLGIADYVLLPGRAAPEKVAGFYALMDLVALPRKPCSVTEIVSPIKPLEAAAQGKRVLMSDVAPLADLAKLCPSHFRYFTKGNVTSLTTELARLLAEGDFSPPPCQSLQRMTWSHNVEPMVRAVHSQKPM